MKQDKFKKMITSGERMKNQPKNTGSSWVWNIVVAEIIGEYEGMDERILYARLEPGQLVPCKMFDHLVDTSVGGGDLVLLEVNETNRSFYYFLQILDPN